jgi:type I restriction enzyme S subunit
MTKKKELTLEERIEQALVPEEKWPYEMPAGWKWVTLIGGFGECLDKYRKPINAKERAKRFGEVPYYGATGQVGWIDDYLLDNDVVLVGEDGAPFFDHIKDKAYLVSGKSWVNNHAHIIKSYLGIIGNKYILHFLNQFNYHGYVNGTTRLKLTQTKLKEIKIPIPPFNKVEKLVNQIENQFEKLDRAKGLIQNTIDSFEDRKAAILHRAFTGELTKKWREENGVGLDSWEMKELQEICEKITDGTHQTPKYVDKGYTFISAKNIKDGKIDWKNVKYIPSDLHKKLYKRLAPRRNDILLAKNGTTGKAAIVEVDDVFDIYVSLALLRPIEGVYPRYLLWVVNSPESFCQFTEHLTGIGVPNLHLRDIRKTNIPIPNHDEQIEIVKRIESLMSCEEMAKELYDIASSIDYLKQTILSKAFRGELVK